MLAACAFTALLSACGGAGDATGDSARGSDPTPPPPSGDTTAPAVSITSPASGSTVSGTVTLSATASDNVGVVGVQFRLNGVNLSTEDVTAPYSLSLDTTSVSNGTYTLTAVARDAAGNTKTSAGVTVTVNNAAPPPPPPGPDTTSPAVTITTPTSATTYATSAASLTLGGGASDNVGVTQVSWSNSRGGSGSQSFSAASIVWSFNNIPLQSGSNAITVTARDAAGNTQTDTLTVTYSPNTTAALAWDANIEPDMAGYRVYWGTTPGVYQQARGAGVVVSGTSYTVTGLTSGVRYYFAVTAYDSAGNESDYSAEVFKDIP
jgi:hypothetical protein